VACWGLVTEVSVTWVTMTQVDPVVHFEAASARVGRLWVFGTLCSLW
jgi:hypothetical protein